MRYPIVIVATLLVCACASRSPSTLQTVSAPGSASFLAGDTGAPTRQQDVAQAPEVLAAQNPEPVAADTREADIANEDEGSISELRTLTIDEADSGRVCESRERPGSRMTRTVCYTREERIAAAAAREEQRDEQLDELQREQRWRDEIIRQAEMSGRRPSGFGLGPD